MFRLAAWPETLFRPTLAGAWIPAVFMVLVQFVCMAIFKEGGTRAVDTSWYDAKTRMYARWNSIFQVMVIILAVFVPLKSGTMWFTVGTVVYAVAVAVVLVHLIMRNAVAVAVSSLVVNYL